MKTFYRIAAGTLGVLAGFAAIGAGAMIVATAFLIGALMALAAKLALNSTATNKAVSIDDCIDADQAPA